MQTQQKERLQRHILTFLTEFASEAIRTLALLPRPVVHTGAPVSAGVGGAGSFQSRTSTDTITHKLTIRQWIWQVSHTGGGSAEKGNSKNRSRWAVISIPVRQYKKTHKEPQRISILKDLSSLRYSRGRQWGKKFSGILQLVSPVKNLPFVLQKKKEDIFLKTPERVWKCEQMSHSESQGG